MQERGLAIHTSSAVLGLARMESGTEQGDRCWDVGRDLSVYLFDYLSEFLQPWSWETLSFLAVACGPGSFTGTRIGVTLARTLAQQLEIPLFGVSSLAAWVWFQRKGLSLHRDIAVEMAAQRGEIFGGIYRIQHSVENLPGEGVDAPGLGSGLTAVLPDGVFSEGQWQETVTHWSTPVLVLKVEEELGSSVSGVLELGAIARARGERPHWSEVLPFYGQHPVVSRAG